MASKLPESTRSTYARQLADEAKTLIPGAERLVEIVVELRTDDLFRLLGFDTWAQFCTEYLGISKWTANRLIAGPKPKSIAAGQGVAAVQDAPIVESDTLKSPAASTEAPAKQSEGGGTGTNQPPAVVDHQLAPSGPSSAGGTGKVASSAPSKPGFDDPGSAPPPAGLSSRVARATASPLRRDAPTEVPPTSRPAPPDPSAGGAALGEVSPTPVRPPTDRALTARVFAAMRDIDPTDAGPVTTPEEVTFLRQWAQRTLDAWKAVHAPPAPAEKPQRRHVMQPALVGVRPINGSGKRHADDCSCLSCAPVKG